MTTTPSTSPTAPCRRSLIEELFALVRKDPKCKNAGAYAQAAAELMFQEHHEQRHASGWREFEQHRPSIEKLVVSIIDQLRAKPADKPPATQDQRRLAAEAYVDSFVDRQIAMALLQRAAQFEHMSEIGHPPGLDHRNVTIDSTYRPTLNDEQRRAAHEEAERLRNRAIELLSSAGVPEPKDYQHIAAPML